MFNLMHKKEKMPLHWWCHWKEKNVPALVVLHDKGIQEEGQPAFNTQWHHAKMEVCSQWEPALFLPHQDGSM